MRKKRWLSVLIAAGIVAAQCVLPVGDTGSAFVPQASAAFVSWSIQQTSNRELAPGLTQTEFTYTLGDMTSRYTTLTLKPDSEVELRPVMPWDGTSVGLQTVRNMANSAIVNGNNVVAAVNGDMYNMSTGEPWGVVIQDKNLVHGYNVAGRDWPFFGFTEEGKVLYGRYADYTQMWPQLTQAMGLHCVLVENQRNVCTDTSTTRAPRTAVGVKQDGSIFFLTADGRQDSSEGLSLTELADLMIKEGAVWAGNLDGGGSTTVVSREPGADALSVQNVPSDGSERRVANGWIFVAPGSPTQAQMTATQNDLYGRVVSDTTRPFVLKPGSTYQFCMTLVSGSNPPNCITDDPEHYTVTYTGNSGRNYYYKITAKPGAAGANVYSTVPGADPVLQCKLLAAG